MSRSWTVAVVLLAGVGVSGCSAGEPQVRQQTLTEEVQVAAHSGIEFKLYLNEGDTIGYDWTAPASLYYDFHGEPQGAAPGEFTSHKEGRAAADTGTLTAPFAGTHGWYWENNSDQAARVSLQVDGTFAVVGIK